MCQTWDAFGPDKGLLQLTRRHIPANLNFHGKTEGTVTGDDNSQISKGVFKGYFSIN